MSDSVQMPALGESVTEGTVTRWLKQVGDRVEVDEPLLEVSTDKVDTEIPSPVAGVVERILVAEDEAVEVGADLVVIGDGASGSDGAQPADQQQGGQPEQDDQAAEPPAEQDGSGGQDDGGEQQTEQPPAPAGESTSDDAGSDSSSGANGSGGGQEVSMPALGESVTEGTVTRWLKSEGDTVEMDEPLLEVSTDKVDTEIPSPVAGVLRKIMVAEDETVQVGAPLALIGDGASGGGTGGGSARPTATGQSTEQSTGQDTGPDTGAASSPGPDSTTPEASTAAPAPETPVSKASASDAPAAQPAPQGSGSAEAPAARASTAQAPVPASASSDGQGGAQQARPAGQGTAGDGAGYVTPLVRRMAAEHGVDLDRVTGTGVGGRIRKQDVLDAAKAAADAESTAAQQAPAAPAGDAARPAARPAPAVSALRGTTEKMSRLRKVIAQRMVESLQTSAQLTTVVEVDVTRIARLRDRAKADFAAREGAKLSFLPFFALASVEALKQHPTVNASIEGDQIVYHPQENLGIAVDTDKGLIVPVIKDAGDLNLAGLARRIADLAARTRSNKVTPDELGGGTFTLTNTGSRGALFDTPIINQPQVGILGTGAVVKRPVVVTDADGAESIAIRSIAYLALSYDHRLVDGADAARFLVTVKDRLEEGAFEADLGL